LGCKATLTESILLRLDLRDTVTNKKSGGSYPHHPEVLLGVSGFLSLFAPPPAPEQAPPQQDADRDGFHDGIDRCPTEIGVAPDGCPAADSDADTFPDSEDKCPSEPGTAPDGCPARDNDGDGVNDDADKCPAQAGVAPDGCPPADTDQDGILDPNDRCPREPETRNGYIDADGCPDQLPQEVARFNGVVEGIEFEQRASTLRSASLLVLDAAVELLSMYPEFRLAITVYDHGKGDATEARPLNQARADSVKAYLVKSGVAEGRLISQAGERDQGGDGGQGRRVVFALLPME
jgi:OOP family OmpA-OmpF porin